MLLSEANITELSHKDMISDFINYLRTKNLPIDMHEVSPVDVIEFLRAEYRNNANRKHLFTDTNKRLKRTINFLVSKSEYVMSLFFQHNSIIPLIISPTFDSKEFDDLFKFFLDCAKKHSTDPKGQSSMSMIPKVLSEDRSELPSWFKTDINDCFRFSLVIEFYIWLKEQGKTFDPLITEEAANIIFAFIDHLRPIKTRGSFKKSQCLLSYILHCMEVRTGTVRNVEELNDATIKVVDDFITAKSLGIKIHFNYQLVSDTTWTRTNLPTNRTALHRFFRRVIKERGDNIEAFLPFSLTLEDLLMIQRKYGLDKMTLAVLKQFIPWLLENKQLTDFQRQHLTELYMKMPSKIKSTISATPSETKKSAISKNWLRNRSDLVTLFQSALNDSIPKVALRYAVLFGLCFFCALRIGEAMGVRVKNFILEESTLELADMGHGYGVLTLPAFQTKGGRCPSIPPYHIAVVPALRSLINSYLNSDHMLGYGRDTLLMRHRPVRLACPIFDNVDDNRYSNGIWLETLTGKGKNIITQIVDRAMPFLKYKPETGNISAHDFRRSANNFIVDAPFKHSKRIGEIFLRHKKRGSVNEIHYTAEPSPQEYFKCINSALNFPPLSHDQLAKWEEDHNIVVEEEIIEKIGGITKYSSYESDQNIDRPLTSYPSLNISTKTEPPEALAPQIRKILALKKERDELISKINNKDPRRIALTAKMKEIETALITLGERIE